MDDDAKKQTSSKIESENIKEKLEKIKSECNKFEEELISCVVNPGK